MAWDILYAVLIIIFAIGSAYFITWARDRKYIKQDTLEFVTKTFGLGVAVIDELNLSNEKQIMEIADIVEETLNFYNTIGDEDKMLKIVTDYAYLECKRFGIETEGDEYENRRKIIDTLILAGVQQLYKEEVK